LTGIGVQAIEKALERADYLLIDEIGPMELQDRGFQEAVLKALKSPKPILGIIHWKMRHPIIDAIKARQDTKVFELTYDNRDTKYKHVLNEIRKELKDA
jgi:nucleoside-triphosphatase